MNRRSDMVISGKVFQQWSQGDCIYAWKRDGKYLYIGASTRGLNRPLCHSVIDTVEDVRDGDSIELWFFEGLEHPKNGGTYPLYVMEREMIRRHRPPYNITDNPDRVPRLSERQVKLREENRQNEYRRSQITTEDEIGWSTEKPWED